MSVASLDPDGAPRQAVVWFRLEPDGRILLNGRLPRRWCANLVRDPRVGCRSSTGDDHRWIGIVGVVDEVIDAVEPARDDIVALAHRYHPDGPDPDSIAAFRTQPRVSFLIRPTSVYEHLED